MKEAPATSCGHARRAKALPPRVGGSAIPQLGRTRLGGDVDVCRDSLPGSGGDLSKPSKPQCAHRYLLCSVISLCDAVGHVGGGRLDEYVEGRANRKR